MRKHTPSLIACALLAAGVSANAHAQEEVTIGWTAWSDAEFVTKLAERILSDHMDQEVELTQTDIAPQYQGIAEGDIDVMLMSWLPGTHAEYMEEVGEDVVNLGILYTDARLGWVVPDYIPEDELSSIEDLKDDDIRDKLDGTITGIDPGAGLTERSKETIDEYGLDYDLQTSSGSGMTAALERANRNEDWIVVTGWSPHWKFGRWDLRYLEDPEGTLGSAERIHAMAREGFYQDNTEAASMLARMHIPLSQLENYMNVAQEDSYEEAVDQYIDENSDRVEYWISGEM